MRSVVIALVSVSVGVLGGLALRAPAALTPPAAAPITASPTGALVAHVDPAEIRAAVRAELAAHTSPACPDIAAPPSSSAAPASPAPVLDPSFSREAWAGASERLDRAVADGVWSDDDALAFRSELGRVSASDARDLTERLVVAINEGRLDVTGLSVPL